MGGGEDHLLLRKTRFGHGGELLLVDGDHQALLGFLLGGIDHRIVPRGGDLVGGGQLLLVVLVRGIVDRLTRNRGTQNGGGRSLLLQIRIHGIGRAVVELGLTVIHQRLGRGGGLNGRGGGTGTSVGEFLGYEAIVGRILLPVHLGGVVAVLLILLGRGGGGGRRLVEGQVRQILILRGGRGGLGSGSLLGLLQHLPRFGIHHSHAATRTAVARGLLSGGDTLILIAFVGRFLGAAAVSVQLLSLFAVGLLGGGLAPLLGLSLLFLAADSLLLGGLLTPYLDSGPELTENVGGGHTHQQHDNQRQGHHGQGDGTGELQTRVQGEAHQTAHHAAALKDGARTEEMVGGVDLSHGWILGANTHVDDRRDHDHEEHGQDDLHRHQILLAVPPPEDGEVHEQQRDEVGGPAEASEEDPTEVEAHEAREVLGGGLGISQGVQHQKHRKDEGQPREYVGQKLLREGASALDPGGLLTVVGLLGLFGGGFTRGGFSACLFGGGGFGCHGGFFLGGSLGRGGGGHGSLPLGGGLLGFLVFGHRSTSCSMVIFMR